MPKAAPQTEPPHQDFNIGVKALIVRGDRILVLKRHDLPRWEVPGGRINSGEDARQTLKRELSEELPNIRRIRIGHVLHAEQTDFTLPNGHRLMLLFYRVSAEVTSHIELSEEHVEATWASLSELAALETSSPILTAANLAFHPLHP